MDELADNFEQTGKRDNPLATIKFRPIPRSRVTEHPRPLKTIHLAPPPRRTETDLRPLKTIHVIPPPRPDDPELF